MKDNLLIIGICGILIVCAHLGFETYRIKRLVDAGSYMSLTAQKFERRFDEKKEILILGDSLAYGVGSSNPENSFAGVLAQKFPDKSIENNAEIGETTKSLQNTLDKKLDGNYETIYIIIGGNDIMRMHINLFTSKKSLNSIVKKTSKHANKIVLVTTGNFKYVSLSPAALRGVFDMRAKMLRDSALTLEAESDEIDYIDFYSVPLKESEYKQLEAADGYHLSDDGIQRLVAAIP